MGLRPGQRLSSYQSKSIVGPQTWPKTKFILRGFSIISQQSDSLRCIYIAYITVGGVVRGKYSKKKKWSCGVHYINDLQCIFSPWYVKIVFSRISICWDGHPVRNKVPIKFILKIPPPQRTIINCWELILSFMVLLIAGL